MLPKACIMYLDLPRSNYQRPAIVVGNDCRWISRKLLDTFICAGWIEDCRPNAGRSSGSYLITDTGRRASGLIGASCPTN